MCRFRSPISSQSRLGQGCIGFDRGRCRGTDWYTGSLGGVARPERLVTTGVYATSRNPMYVGWALLHLGFGLVGGSTWVLGAFPAATWLVHRQVLHEERDLREAFPDEFARYRAAVPRYLPTRRLSAVAGHTARRRTLGFI